jgi:glycosyltransferase involved in cell wall biosynthesis
MTNALVNDAGDGAPQGPGVPGLVSVVIPTYNRARLIGHAIQSALDQTYPAIEVVVADDGSMDDTADVARAYGARVRYLRRPNGGVAAARNLGLRHAHGEFIAFLDSDDRWYPWKIAAQVAVLRRRPEVGMVWTDMTAVDPAGRVRAPRYLRTMYTAYQDADITSAFEAAIPLGSVWSDAPTELGEHPVYVGEMFPYMFLGNLVHTSTVVMRRAWAATVGGFDEALQSGEDYPYHFHTTALGPVALIDAPSIQYGIGATDQLSGPRFGIQIARHTLRTILQALAQASERITLPAVVIAARLARAHAWVGEEELRAGNRDAARRHLWTSLRHDPWHAWVAALLFLAWLPAGAFGGARAVRHALRRVGAS